MSVTEARPIPLDQLDAREKKILIDVNQRLLAISVDVDSKYPDGWPWARVETNRSGRVLVLNGDRGTGKTSLLMTLLKEWKDARRRDPPPPEPSFAEVALRVRALPVLDFDPLPEAMPLHGWLLQPWRHLAELADRRMPASAGYGDGQIATLRERWHNLFETATIGWSKVPPDGRGVVERALDYELQSSGWLELRSQWHSFVAELLSALCLLNDDENALPLPTNSVLVVPIDDVDLQVLRLPELLHAIRLLHHPRVVYLLTADVEHMKEVLELEFQGKHRKLNELDNDDSEQIHSQAKRLATALLEKSLPTHAQFSLRRVGLKEILKHEVPSGTLCQTLNVRKWKEEEEEEEDLGMWLDDNAAGRFDELLTYRQLQHLCDRIEEMRHRDEVPDGGGQRSTQGGQSDNGPRARADEIIRTLIDPERLYTRSAEKGPVRYERDARVYAGSRTILGSDWVKPGQARIVRGTDLEYRILDEGKEIGQLGDPDPSAALAVLLMDSYLVSAPALEWEVGIAMVWTQWRNSPGDAVSSWPLFRHPNPLELTRAQDNWAGFLESRKGKKREIDEDLDEIARAWVVRTMDWAQGEFDRHDVPVDWQCVIKKVVEWAKSTDKDNETSSANFETLQRNLFLFVSPLLGLPQKTRHGIYTAAVDILKQGDVLTSEEWERNLSDALVQGNLHVRKEMKFPPQEDIDEFDSELKRRDEFPEWRRLMESSEP